MEVFDRDFWNRCYVTWLRELYDVNPELACELDAVVIPKLGVPMAQRIKEKLGSESQDTLGYLSAALRLTHWFQEDVEIEEIGEKALKLQTRNCSLQCCWQKKYGRVLDCPKSHKPFLENFCWEINKTAGIKLVKSPEPLPEDEVYCAWIITIE